MFHGLGTETLEVAKVEEAALTLLAFEERCNHFGFDVQQLLVDLSHVRALLMVALKKTAPSAAREGKRFLEDTPRCTLFNSLLTKTAQGQALMSDVDSLLEVCAADEVGDRRFQLALEGVTGEDTYNLLLTFRDHDGSRSKCVVLH